MAVFDSVVKISSSVNMVMAMLSLANSPITAFDDRNDLKLPITKICGLFRIRRQPERMLHNLAGPALVQAALLPNCHPIALRQKAKVFADGRIQLSDAIFPTGGRRWIYQMQLSIIVCDAISCIICLRVNLSRRLRWLPYSSTAPQNYVFHRLVHFLEGMLIGDRQT